LLLRRARRRLVVDAPHGGGEPSRPGKARADTGARARCALSLRGLAMLTLHLRSKTPRSWAERAVANLPAFVADHAVCELQASVHALSLVGSYPKDTNL